MDARQVTRHIEELETQVNNLDRLLKEEARRSSSLEGRLAEQAATIDRLMTERDRYFRTTAHLETAIRSAAAALVETIHRIQGDQDGEHQTIKAGTRGSHPLKWSAGDREPGREEGIDGSDNRANDAEQRSNERSGRRLDVALAELSNRFRADSDTHSSGT